MRRCLSRAPRPPPGSRLQRSGGAGRGGGLGVPQGGHKERRRKGAGGTCERAGGAAEWKRRVGIAGGAAHGEVAYRRRALARRMKRTPLIARRSRGAPRPPSASRVGAAAGSPPPRQRGRRRRTEEEE
eukprot:scaffold7885_cov69-Phaeocystis_antarctica.AAC.2